MKYYSYFNTTFFAQLDFSPCHILSPIQIYLAMYPWINGKVNLLLGTSMLGFVKKGRLVGGLAEGGRLGMEGICDVGRGSGLHGTKWGYGK